jgi:TRAP-type C4-dicarboxylate transport system permease small subunit
MERFGYYLDRINRVVEMVSAGMLAVMVIVIFLQVIFRSVIKTAIPWSEELARYLMVWMTFLGAGIAVKRRGHIGVEALVRLLPPSGKKAALLFSGALSMILFVSLIILGYNLLGIVKPQLSPAMGLSMAIPYSAIFIGGILMLLYSFYDFLKATGAPREGN